MGITVPRRYWLVDTEQPRATRPRLVNLRVEHRRGVTGWDLRGDEKPRSFKYFITLYPYTIVRVFLYGGGIGGGGGLLKIAPPH